MILLVGDTFIDRYWVGKVRGMSAEAPIPILDTQDPVDFPGGAHNVQANLEALGQEVQYLWETSHIPVKNRLVTMDGLQLARWDEEDYCNRDRRVQTFPLVDAVIVSDYGKGSVDKELIETLLSSYPDALVFVDTKRDPMDWISAGERLVLFPNLQEYHRYQPSYDWFPRVLLKQGQEGMSWMEYGRVIMTQPSLAKKVVSVNGAGDTVLAAFSAATLAGATVPVAMQFASMAAGVVVEKPFTATASLEEIAERYGLNSPVLRQTQ